MKAPLEAVATLRNLRGDERQDEQLFKAHRMSVLPIITGFASPPRPCLPPLLQKLFQLLKVTSFCSVLITARVIKLGFFSPSIQ